MVTNCVCLAMQTFALSPTEMGQLIVQNTFSLIHDPMKGQA